jgi:hypothetical protein
MIFFENFKRKKASNAKAAKDIVIEIFLTVDIACLPVSTII